MQGAKQVFESMQTSQHWDGQPLEYFCKSCNRKPSLPKAGEALLETLAVHLKKKQQQHLSWTRIYLNVVIKVLFTYP